MKLYTHALSPFSGKVRIALDEKSVAFEEELLPISRQAILHKPKARSTPTRAARCRPWSRGISCSTTRP